MVDTRWYLLVNGWAKSTPGLHGVAAWYAVDGVALFVLALLSAFWCTRRASDRAMATALWAGVGTVVVVGVNQLFVAGVHRIRPYWVLAHVEVLVPRTHDYSFPSDHAVTAGAVAAGLWLVSRAVDVRALRRLALAGGVGALLLAADRVYVGAHYPGDVVAGLFVGALLMMGSERVVRGLLTRLVTQLRASRVRRLVTTSVNPPAA